METSLVRNKLATAASRPDLEKRVMLSGGTQATSQADLTDAADPDNGAQAVASASASDTGTATSTVTIRKIPAKGPSRARLFAESGATQGGQASTRSQLRVSRKPLAAAAEASFEADGLVFAGATADANLVSGDEVATANAAVGI